METRSNHVLVGAVVLILLAVTVLVIVWFARLNGNVQREYDIFFRESVDGLAKGSQVTFSGVPSGEVEKIAFYYPNPQLVRVRIAVNEGTPVLEGTTATIQSSFTGPSNIQLEGALKGAPPIACPQDDPKNECPYGVPIIPTKPGALGALFNSAPKLLDRLATLTERLTELMSDKNQASIAGILANTNRLSKALADRGPEIAATLAETRVTVQKAGVAAEQIGQLAQTTNGMMTDDVRPAMHNLNQAISSAKQSMDTLDATIKDARPGVETFSKQTMPQVAQLVQDLRQMAAALTDVADKVDHGGPGSLIGGQRLPDYKGK